MVRIGAAELQRQFGSYSEQAQRAPLTITKHGRDSLVLLSAEAYERLRSLDTRKSYSIFELPDDVAEAILDAKAPTARRRKGTKKSS
jgi:prevent-host-death family protein